MNEIVERLQGRTAIVQIIVDGECHLRRVGDVNGLIDHPELVAPSATESFLEWMSRQIEVAAVCEATKGNHRNCLDHLRRFRPTMTFADVNFSLVSEFDAYLRALKLKVNTIAKIMKVWHRYINIALGDDLLVRDPFRKYTIRKEDTHKPSLTERELQKLERGVDTLPDDERSVVRAFLFSCYTGLRYSDLCRVRRDDIKTLARQKWLCLRTQKTGSEVRIPLSVAFAGNELVHFGLTGTMDQTFESDAYLKSVVIPSGVTTLGSTFSRCSRLTSVTLPSTITNLGNASFRYCYSLASITLPTNITSIGEMLFQGCPLTAITIPSGVTSVKTFAFDSCSRLTEMIFLGTTPPTLSGTRPLGVTTLTFPFYVPDASVDAYKAASGWSNYASRVKGISERPTQE